MQGARHVWVGFGCGILIALSFGCQPSNVAVPASTQPLLADDVWERTLAAYRNAKTYRDNGTVRLTYTQNGRPEESKGDVSVRFVRPNMIRINAYQAQLSCDEKEVRAKITDASTHNMEGQFVARPLRKQLSLDELYEDEKLRAQMSNGVIRPEMPGEPLQLQFLLAESPLAELGPNLQRHLLTEEKINDKPHYKLAVKGAKGEILFWIDPTSFLIKRAEYSSEFLLPEMTHAPDVHDIHLIAEFTDARINEEIGANLFTLEVPTNAKLVRFFVPPPQRLPSDMFGKKPGNFSLRKTTEGNLTQADLADKIAVLIWFNDYPACETMLQALQHVRASLSDVDAHSTAIYAVCSEPGQMSDKQVLDLVNRWGVTLPVVRDVAAVDRDVFHIEGVPTLVVLDPMGVVQVVETGGNPELAKELPEILAQIRKGESLAQRVLDQQKDDQAKYERQLSMASGETATKTIELRETAIKEKSQPKRLKLERQWSSTDIANPGNLLVIGDGASNAGEQDGMIVLDGANSVVQLDWGGVQEARHELRLPNKSRVNFLRTHRNGDGKRYFAGAAHLGKQFFVFDDQWKLLFEYPPADQPHDGICDVRFADLDDDGKAELYVGFWGVLGVHRVSFDGQQEWSNRTIPSAMTLAVSPQNEIGWRKLMVAGDQGRLLRLNQFGNHDPPTVVRGWMVSQLYSGNFAPTNGSVYCGIAYTPEGNLIAVALDATLQEQWNYPFTPGLHSKPIEFVTSGALRGPKTAEWVFAAADGSIHIVSADGDFSDHFNFGETLTGIAVQRRGNHCHLIVSTTQGVSAWSVKEKEFLDEPKAEPKFESPKIDSPKTDAPKTDSP